jgi:y4mF family transcriptional regulator
MEISKFVKERRSLVGLTQPELAEKAGVGLRFVRDLEQGKQTLRLDKVNQVLQLFGFQLGPVELKRETIVESLSPKDKVDAKVIRKKGKS